MVTRFVFVFARSALALLTATVLVAAPAAAQDEFEEFPEKFDEFDPQRSFTGWAMGVARNKVLQYFDKTSADRHRFSND